MFTRVDLGYSRETRRYITVFLDRQGINHVMCFVTLDGVQQWSNTNELWERFAINHAKEIQRRGIQLPIVGYLTLGGGSPTELEDIFNVPVYEGKVK